MFKNTHETLSSQGSQDLYLNLDEQQELLELKGMTDSSTETREAYLLRKAQRLGNMENENRLIFLCLSKEKQDRYLEIMFYFEDNDSKYVRIDDRGLESEARSLLQEAKKIYEEKSVNFTLKECNAKVSSSLELK